MFNLSIRTEIAIYLSIRTEVTKRKWIDRIMSLFPPSQLPLAAASPLSITKKSQSVIMHHKLSTITSRLLSYLAIPATWIIHLFECENKKSYCISKIIISIQKAAYEDTAKRSEQA